jgi:hypothetical protein
MDLATTDTCRTFDDLEQTFREDGRMTESTDVLINPQSEV